MWRPNALCAAVLWAVLCVPTAAQPVSDLHGLGRELEHLWNLVVVQQQSRNVPQGEGPPIQRVCQYGLSEGTLELARWMLTVPEPPVEELDQL
ncbi:unnamed protein product, partial [Durusdinium trenchii]